MNADRVELFRREYRRAVDDLLPLFTRDRLAVLGRHNPGWGASLDVEAYLRASEARYLHALRMAEAVSPGSSGGTILDIGGFMGTFPLALARMGADLVAISEKYSYYYGAFDEVRDRLVAEGVRVWDKDLTKPLDPLPPERFGLVTAMAIIEHLADSPKPLLENARSVLADGGRVLVEAPSIAYWPKRWGLLRGRSPHPSLRDVFESEPPFTGHHREYTPDELRQVMEWSGFRIDAAESFNYTPRDVAARWRPLLVWPSRLQGYREILMVIGSADRRESEVHS